MKSALLLFYFLLFAASSSILTQIDAQPLTKRDITYRITGGERVPEKQKFARFMVSLRSRNYKQYFGDNHFCAGIIISSSWVLTAATCVSDKRKVPIRPRRLMIVAGTPNRLQRSTTTLELEVKSIRIHSNFAHKGPYNVALVRIVGAFPTDNPNIEIMTLPEGAPPYGNECLILGWGRMYLDGPVAAGILHTKLSLMAEEECKSLYTWHKPALLCAIDRAEGAHDACTADSGGPLICNDKLAGIISFSVGCGERSGPSLFTSIYHSLSFIKEAMNAANRNLLALLPMVLCTVEMAF